MAFIVYDSMEEVPEALRESATPKDGKFLVDAAGLIKKNSELLSEIKKANDLKKKLKDFEGLDPAEAREALELKQKAAEEKAKAEGNWNSIKDQMTKKHNEEKAALEAKLVKGQKALEKALIDSAIAEAVTKHKGNIKLLRGPIRETVKLVEDSNGEFQVHILDAKGNARISNTAGDLMTIDQYVKEMSEDKEYAPAFSASGKSGSGAQGSADQGGNGVVKLTREQAKDSRQYQEAVKRAGSVDKVLVEG